MDAMTLRSRQDQNFPDDLDEDTLVRNIARYKHQLAELGTPATPHQRGMHNNYHTLLRYGRKLLAALRDGRPEAWMTYPD